MASASDEHLRLRLSEQKALEGFRVSQDSRESTSHPVGTVDAANPSLDSIHRKYGAATTFIPQGFKHAEPVVVDVDPDLDAIIGGSGSGNEAQIPIADDEIVTLEHDGQERGSGSKAAVFSGSTDRFIGVQG